MARRGRDVCGGYSLTHHDADLVTVTSDKRHPHDLDHVHAQHNNQKRDMQHKLADEELNVTSVLELG